MSYILFQPNPKQLKTTDCTIRAICAVTGLSWYEVFDKVVEFARENCCMFNDKNFAQERLKLFGLKRRSLSKTKKGEKSITVNSFCEKYPKGKFILSLAHHNVGVVDGNFYDIWNCGTRKVYCFYELEE